MLHLQPEKRIDAEAALRHPYFDDINNRIQQVQQQQQHA